LVRESSTSQGDFVLRQNHGQKLLQWSHIYNVWSF
jgi:hypothetical protein